MNRLSDNAKNLIKYAPETVNALADTICESFGDYVLSGIQTRTTNADRIRAMTDEELAQQIVKCRDSDIFRQTVLGTKMNTARDWLDWLGKEADDDTEK